MHRIVSIRGTIVYEGKYLKSTFPKGITFERLEVADKESYEIITEAIMFSVDKYKF